MHRLTTATLANVPAAVHRPTYDRDRLETGIVHLGVGAFHRAHQAVYSDDVLTAGDMRWGTLGASLRATDTRDALAPQDFLYTVSERDADGERLRIIGSLREILVAPENPTTLIEAMSAPSVKIVSLTVTEKGYCHDPATGDLDEDHPDIRHDLAHPEQIRSAPGFLAAALRLRRERGLQPFTVLCCDNLPSNGTTVRKVVTRMASLTDRDFGQYVGDHVAFPATMVDRIVPATTEIDRARIAAAIGQTDSWPVMTERYSQWVIEDRFPQGRPAWAATFVSDVAPFEQMKLRLLNGAHSSLAYLGYLAGHETVSGAMSDPALSHFVEHLMNNEVTPTLAVPASMDLAAYKQALLHRFRNPSLLHRTWQIAMDGSQKLPQRLLGTARDRLRSGHSIDALALGIAAWMRYVTGIDEQGGPIDVRDPLRDELRRRCDGASRDAKQLATALLAMKQVFGEDLSEDKRFVSAVTAALDRLIRFGARHTLEQFRNELP